MFLNHRAISNSTIVGSTLLVGILATSSVVSAGEGQFYLGAGGGQSTIKPATQSVDVSTGFSVDDNSDGLIKLFAGYDLTEYWSVEGFYANYGTAKLSGPASLNQISGTAGLDNNFLNDEEIINGNVDYSILGAQTLIQFPHNGPGLSALLKLGVSRILTNSSNNLPFTQADEIKFTTGFGMEYSLKNGVAVRAEYEYHDENIQGVSISALKRFGKAKVKTVPAPKQKVVAKPQPQKQSSQKPAPAAKKPQPQPKPAVRPQAPAAPKPQVAAPAPQRGLTVAATMDSDADGIIDQADLCPGTPPGTRVTATGCPVLVQHMQPQVVESVQSYQPVQSVGAARILDGVTFKSGSATLTPEARQVLNGIADELNQRPDVSIAVIGHTDNLGNAAKNKKLSERRAEAVANYIASRGFDPQRLRYGGKGEEMPIMSNDTAAGRAVNRRVELIEE